MDLVWVLRHLWARYQFHNEYGVYFSFRNNMGPVFGMDSVSVLGLEVPLQFQARYGFKISSRSGHGFGMSSGMSSISVRGWV